MVLHLLVGLMVILIGAELFTNGVEWLGNRFGLSEGAVGNLLAAVGTALPESIIPIVAFYSGMNHGVSIGVGAIFGAPFMLGTLAMFITGFFAFLFPWRGQGRKILQVDASLVARDLQFFILMFLCVLFATILPHSGQMVIVVILIGGYLYYAYVTVYSGDSMQEDNLKPLYLSRGRSPHFLFILLQLGIGLSAIVGGAHYFVSGIEHVAALFGIQPLILALIIAPIATELPEKFNSVIWIAQKKDALALGNITGAMVFQSTLIPAFGIYVTSWRLDLPSYISSFFVLLSVIMLYVYIKKFGYITSYILMCCGLCYAGFIATMLWSVFG